MKRYSSIILFIATLLAWQIYPAYRLSAQTGVKSNDRQLCQEVFSAIRHATMYTYHYEMNMDYPNGDKDRLAGDVYCDVVSARMLNKSTAGTMMLTRDWYMSAQHDKQVLVVYNIAKILAKEKRSPDALQKEFREAMQQGLPDSAILQKGKIENATVVGNMVSIVLSFPADSRVQRLAISYNRSSQMLEEIRVSSFHPYNSNYGGKKLFKGEGTTQEIVCSNYRKTFSENVFAVASYFKVQGNSKVIPIQYKNYKLTTN